MEILQVDNLYSAIHFKSQLILGIQTSINKQIFENAWIENV